MHFIGYSTLIKQLQTSTNELQRLYCVWVLCRTIIRWWYNLLQLPSSYCTTLTFHLLQIKKVLLFPNRGRAVFLVLTTYVKNPFKLWFSRKLILEKAVGILILIILIYKCIFTYCFYPYSQVNNIIWLITSI